MDTELFMECEEEELEPWQQVDDSVEEDDMDFMDNYCEPVEDSSSPLPASETPPPRSPPPAPVHIVSSSSSSLAPPPAPPPPPPPPPSSSSSAPPLVAQAPPLFLTQTPTGTFLLPAAAAGTGSNPPIFLTAQGFPVQTVVNPAAPLLLNLQPGQTVQPLTLIQSPSLGQLVRPSIGVSPILPQGQTVQTRTPPGGPAHSGPAHSGPAHSGPAHPAFTAVQLPSAMTIRSSLPGSGNFQVSGATSLKMAASPALPSGSANGVKTKMVRSGTTGSTHCVAMASAPPKVVMSVEEFYYGEFEGDLNLRKLNPPGAKSSFSCQICCHQAENNLRLMQHMLQHSDLLGSGSSDDKTCRFCFRQFSSSAQLQNHQDQVHTSNRSSCICRICEWAFENEPVFLNHMQTNHKPGEMPYICQVCSYRSSFYSDVVHHFANFHQDSRFLLCVFCLKVTRNPAGYQQHLLRHQVNQAFHCNRCRLQFIFLKDKMQHKLENHRSVRRPAQLEGLPAGSKVTIRTYGKARPPVTSAGGGGGAGPVRSGPLIEPIHIKTEPQRPYIQKNPNISGSTRSPNKRPGARRTSRSLDRLLCLECGTDASDFPAHYPTHVRCLLCPYSSCCSRAYAAHMIHHHVPHSKNKVLPLHRRPPPCPYLLSCSSCGFRPQSADQMAEHLVMNQDHHSATCCSRTHERKPYFSRCLSEDAVARFKDEISSQLPTTPCTERTGLSITPTQIDCFVDDTAAALHSVLDLVAPLKKKFTTPRRLAPWFDSSIQTLKQASRRMERKWRSSKSAESQRAWRVSLLRYKRALRQARTAYYSSLMPRFHCRVWLYSTRLASARLGPGAFPLHNRTALRVPGHHSNNACVCVCVCR